MKAHPLLDGIVPKCIYTKYPLSECPIPLIGRDINRFIDKTHCKSILVVAATLGEKFDRTLRRIQLVDMATAIILDREAGFLLERFLDENVGINRYSPGYGDFPLSISRDIIDVLNTSIKIGLCITDDFVLTPQKSVTAIVTV